MGSACEFAKQRHFVAEDWGKPNPGSVLAAAWKPRRDNANIADSTCQTDFAFGKDRGNQAQVRKENWTEISDASILAFGHLVFIGVSFYSVLIT